MNEQQIMEALRAGTIGPEAAYTALMTLFQQGLGWDASTTRKLALDRIHQLHPDWTPLGLPDVGAGGGGVDLPPGETERQYGPYTAYLKALGLGTTEARTPFQRYQEAQYAPMQDIYNMQSQMWAAPGMTVAEQTPWEQWAGRYAPAQGPTAGGQYKAPVSISERSKTLLSQLYGATPGQREMAGLTFEPQYNEAGEFTGAGSPGQFQSALMEALRPTAGGRATKWLTGNIPREQQRYMSLLASGELAQETPFLDYYKRRYPQAAF